MRDHRYRGPTAELGQPRKRPSSSHPDAGSRRSPARPQSHGIRWPAIRVPPLPAPDSGSQMGADGAVDGSASCREAAATANPACIGAPTVALRRCPRSLAGADGGGGASASGSAYRWEVSSVTMSAADCGCSRVRRFVPPTPRALRIGLSDLVQVSVRHLARLGHSPRPPAPLTTYEDATRLVRSPA